MLLYCLDCTKKTESGSPKVATTKIEKIMLLLKYVVCDSKKSKFIKEQEASALLSSLGMKATLCEIPLERPLLF